MSQSFPLFNRWLSQVGPDLGIEALTDLLDAGAVFTVDAAGKILFWSRGAEKLFGLPGDRVIGIPCTDALACEEGHDPCGLAERRIIKAEFVRIRRQGGGHIACYRTARAFFDGNGQFAGAIEFLQPQTAALG